MDKSLKTLDTKGSVTLEINECGATLLEYMLMVAVVFLVCVTAVTYLGQQSTVSFSEVGSTLDSVV